MDLGPTEDAALSLSWFAIEDPRTADPVGWTGALLFADEPDTAHLRTALATALGTAPDDMVVERVAAADWAAAAAAAQTPVEVGRFYIHPGHAVDAKPPGRIGIELEAGLAFGSGEHATTQVCLLAIDRLARRRRFRRVLDLGCGSGILAMAAARCWPARVLASDNDPIAIRVARENVHRNRLAGRVRLVLAEGLSHPAIERMGPFDLILANILADPLIELAPVMSRHIAPGGCAVLSGLLDRQAPAVSAAYRRAGLRAVATIGEGPWVGLLFRRPQGSGTYRNKPSH
jgi:ribosomal protein L11 methyltransferase